MLVCNVSLRPPRSAISAAIAEVATAVDAAATGNVVFATLVDDPASVGDIVDAYLGEIMFEAASADAAVDASIPATYAADVAETISAADTQDGSIVAAVTTATWDAATVAAVTLSGGDLVATNTGTTSGNQGAHVAAAQGLTSGKLYYECTITTKTNAFNGCIGVGTTASTYTNMGNSGTTGVVMFWQAGTIWANGGNSGSSIAAMLTGQVCGIAVDLTNRKAWFRVAPSGNWNGSGTANPATNTGGVTIPAGTMVPFVTFGGTPGSASNVITANFGASAFTGALPSGFTSGWPA